MMDILTYIFTAVGLFFFCAGTLGLLRFPDVFSRLHALTKADNLGLGFMVMGLALQAPDWAIAGKLLLIWLLALITAGTVAQLIARAALTENARLTNRRDSS